VFLRPRGVPGTGHLPARGVLQPQTPTAGPGGRSVTTMRTGDNPGFCTICGADYHFSSLRLHLELK